MWNKIVCNRLIQKKFHQKAQQRLERIKKHHKSPYSSKQLSKSLNKSFNAKGKAIQTQKNWLIDRENQNMTSRIKEIKRSSSLKTTKSNWDKSFSIRTIILNNKKRVEQLRQKSIQSENKRLLDKITRTDSSLKKIRMKTSLNSSFEKQKVKSMLFISNLENKNIIKHNVPKLKSIKTEQSDPKHDIKEDRKEFIEMLKKKNKQIQKTQQILEQI